MCSSSSRSSRISRRRRRKEFRAPATATRTGDETAARDAGDMSDAGHPLARLLTTEIGDRPFGDLFYWVRMPRLLDAGQPRATSADDIPTC